MIRSMKSEPLSKQVRKHVEKETKEEKPFEGNFETVISTGSTLLNLAISGKRVRGGGVPGGVALEAFGPSQSGKTALLSEMAGNVERAGGDTQFHDPEARLDEEFASIFGMHIDPKRYFRPDMVTEVFKNVNTWEPTPMKKGAICGIFADSLAALSTNIEMENEDGDKMGGRRAKEFSEGFRKNARILKKNNYIMACSNQIRDNFGAGTYGPKYTTPGGHAFEFYGSIRLKFNSPEKIYRKLKVRGKEHAKVIGIKTDIEVVKSVDEPYRKASIYIVYGYGIDDVRGNLQFIKDNTKNTMYCVGENQLDVSMEVAIKKVEELNLVSELKEEVINLWEEIQEKFEIKREPKQR